MSMTTILRPWKQIFQLSFLQTSQPFFVMIGRSRQRQNWERCMSSSAIGLLTIAQKLAQLEKSINRWRYQRPGEVVIPETSGILNQRKSPCKKNKILVISVHLV
ncbi:Transcription factor CP2-like protein [Dirofilaria immitis]